MLKLRNSFIWVTFYFIMSILKSNFEKYLVMWPLRNQIILAKCGQLMFLIDLIINQVRERNPVFSGSIFHNVIIKILIQIKDSETITFVVILMTIQVRVWNNSGQFKLLAIIKSLLGTQSLILIPNQGALGAIQQIETKSTTIVPAPFQNHSLLQGILQKKQLSWFLKICG